MDRDRFSFLAHASHDIMNPLSSGTLDRAIALAEPRHGQRALDIGCGKAELLLRLAERHGVSSIGIDRSGLFAEQAAARVAARGQQARVAIQRGDAREVIPTIAPGLFDIATCIGSSHALGDVGSTLDAMVRLARPGGRILLGEGYWKKPPSAEYLAALGGIESELRHHAGNVELGASRGLTPLWAVTASDREWDEYEWAYARNIEAFAAANPTDPDVPAMLARSRSWRGTYLAHGRDTLGFALYLFRKP